MAPLALFVSPVHTNNEVVFIPRSWSSISVVTKIWGFLTMFRLTFSNPRLQELFLLRNYTLESCRKAITTDGRIFPWGANLSNRDMSKFIPHKCDTLRPGLFATTSATAVTLHSKDSFRYFKFKQASERLKVKKCIVS